MKRSVVALAVAPILSLVGCSGGSEKPTQDQAESACKEGRVAIMAADADPADLGSDWPVDFELTELKDGSYSATWQEGDPYPVFFECSFTWEDGEAVNVEVDTE